MADLAILVLILGAMTGIIRKKVRDMKAGKAGCGCSGCSGCSGCGTQGECH